MVIKSPQVTKILKDPVEAAKLANLIYVTDNKLTIKRHKHGRGFYYTKNGEKIVDKKSIERFKSLVIPPAWTKVRITHLNNGHLQVVGRDEKNRKQYRYHPSWSEIKNKTKFFKMTAFGNVLPKIRAQIEKDLSLKKMTKRKCLALVLKLMEETHIRIGNEYYAKKNKSYGLSTMRTKHLDSSGKSIKFEFVGKKGKKHEVSVNNKRLKKLVLQCEEIPGWELFQYYDEDGKHHSIDSGMVNDYIHELSGDLFSAKDFRTWAASKLFFEYLYEAGMPKTKKDIKKNILEAYDKAAEGLGNTRSVCRSYYVHPILPEKYEDGTIEFYLKKLNHDTIIDTKPHFSPTETVLLQMIKQYEVIFD
ncbi:DNA topoisomerase IB [Marinirhabdus gelatinilytica]|uniref:DNA topoisomerase n=1 Tax=Marinirhabdus gelatinilytica TaxID=1703343 RepID=A0A370QGB1_9FLAO|nr:DNA topoisomerase IB [Marinirhabdus gelatinilytica]RDK87403.1 DNA topoisomerase-1 [Marinirhabdus gelatinilytica]